MILNLSNVKNKIYEISYDNNIVYKGTLPSILSYVFTKLITKS